MTNKNKIEGTFQLGGILEGKLSSKEESLSLIQEWIETNRNYHLFFQLEVTGQYFSLFAEDRLISVKDLIQDPISQMEQSLTQLLNFFDGTEKRNLFSTLRSLEYKKGVEVQTMYLINPSGAITIQSREVEVVTQEAMTSLGNKKLALYGGILVLTALLLSSFFIDYPELFSDIKENLTPIDVNEVLIENSFDQYFKTGKKEKKGSGVILVTLKRNLQFPKTDAELEKNYQTSSSLKDKLIFQSLAKGHILYEIYNEKGEFIQSGFARIEDLKKNEQITISLSYSKEKKPKKILLKPF